MATQAEQLQMIWRVYEEAGNPTPAPLHDVAEWAVKEGFWKHRPTDLVKECAAALADALRQEYYTDKQGRRVRAKHAARVERNGEQMVFWADMRRAPREYMELSLKQRRQQIVSDCQQLKSDADSYNENHPKERAIQLIFDFTRDLQELELELAAKVGA